MELEICRLEYVECRKKYIHAKFNGHEVMRRFGYSGKELGEKTQSFKQHLSVSGRDFEDFILNIPTEEIYGEFAATSGRSGGHNPD